MPGAETHGLRVHRSVVAVLARRGVMTRKIGGRAEHRIGVAEIVIRQSEIARTGAHLLGRVMDAPADVLLQIWAELLAITANCESSLNGLEHTSE